MAMEKVTARYQEKAEDGTLSVDEEGKVLYSEVEVNYDFGDNLDDAVTKCGADVVFSQFVSAAKVALQGIIRAKNKAGLTQDAIQTIADSWKPGMVVAKTTVDPKQAVLDSFLTWPAEKRQAFLDQLMAAGSPE